MTSGILHSDLTAPQSMRPQFDHTLRPRLTAVVFLVLTLLLIAFFVYGQMAPGA